MKNNGRLPGWGIAQVALLIDFAVKQGLAVEQVLANSGIPASLSFKEDPSLAAELCVIRNLIARIDEAPFRLGLRVGRQSKLHTFGPLGQAFVSCETAVDAAQLALRFFGGEYHFLRVRPFMQQSRMTVSYELVHPHPPAISQFLLGREMGATIAFYELMLEGRNEHVLEIGFQGRELPGMQEVADYFECPLLLEQAQNFMAGDLGDQPLRLPFGNRWLVQMMQRLVEAQIEPERQSASGEAALGDRVAGLMAQTGRYDLSREEVARQLNLSSRTLARYLSEEGTTWRELCINLRMAHARDLLRHTRDSLDMIADKTGYSSTSAFSNAFSRSQGMRPARYRQLHLEEASCPD